MPARVGERVPDRALGDLVERHALGLRRRHVRGLRDVPGDRLALAVEVGGEVDRVGRLRGLADLGDLLLAVVGDHVLRREVVVDVDPELALAGVLRQVPDVAIGGEDSVVVAQVALDRPRLGRRLHDHEVLRHGRECSTGFLHGRSPGTHRAIAWDAGGNARRDRSVRPRGCVGGSLRRARGPRPARPPERPRPAPRPAASNSATPPVDGRISTNRMWRYGKKKIDSIRSTKTGRLPSIIRRFVQRRPWSRAFGISYRSASSGCSLLRCRTAFLITGDLSEGGRSR